MQKERKTGRPQGTKADRAVLDYLREQIVSGQLKPGTKLPSERILSETLGVSRGYVRKALARLEHYSLIETLPQRGTIVAELGSKAISGLLASIGSFEEAFNPASLFEIRALLETFAAKRAAELANKEDMSEIVKWHEEFKAKAAKGERALEEDHLFHLALAKASGNPVCLALLSYITPQIISLNIKYTESDPDRFERTAAEHDKIVDCVRTKNSEGAAVFMQIHMNEAWKRRLPGTFPAAFT